MLGAPADLGAAAMMASASEFGTARRRSAAAHSGADDTSSTLVLHCCLALTRPEHASPFPPCHVSLVRSPAG